MSTERARINVILRSEQSGGQIALTHNIVPAILRHTSGGRSE